MLNLLFISNSPKVQYIKSVLQPVLKVIIDVVPDFDHGLKDVFEKRPSTVCIQEQIAGVTGESVARHIQMLLGTGSPKFILMHEGSSKAKSIKGLFEHVIDLNQSDENLSKNFQDILEVLLGEQWVKIYNPPLKIAESLRPFDPAPESSQVDADRLVEDFLSDLNASNSSTSVIIDESGSLDRKLTVLSSTDEIAEMLLEQSAQAKNNDTLFDKPAVKLDDTSVDRIVEQKPNHVVNDSVPLVASAENSKVSSTSLLKKSPLGGQFEKGEPRDATETVSEGKHPDKVRVEASKSPAVAASVVPSLSSVAADFKIRNKKDSSEDLIPEELLIAFEENYRTESAHTKRNVLVLSVILFAAVAGGWYFLMQKPLLMDAMKQRMMPAKTLVANPSSAVSQTQKSGQERQEPNPVVTSSLPKFIPLQGYDKAYSAKKPGWDRYVGNDAEFRVFNDGGVIKAVQVLSIKGKVLTEPFLKSVLSELTGSADYKLESSKIKSGLTEMRGIVGQKADIVIYKNNESIRAFVVSLNNPL
jgi:hypothetical protein